MAACPTCSSSTELSAFPEKLGSFPHAIGPAQGYQLQRYNTVHSVIHRLPGTQNNLKPGSRAGYNHVQVMQKEIIPECLLPHHFVSSTPHSHAPTPMLLLTPAAPVPSSFPELSDHTGYLRTYCQGLALAFVHMEALQQVLQTNQPQRKISSGRLPDHHLTAKQTHITLLRRLTEHRRANRRVTALQGGGDPGAGQTQVPWGSPQQPEQVLHFCPAAGSD